MNTSITQKQLEELSLILATDFISSIATIGNKRISCYEYKKGFYGIQVINKEGDFEVCYTQATFHGKSGYWQPLVSSPIEGNVNDLKSFYNAVQKIVKRSAWHNRNK